MIFYLLLTLFAFQSAKLLHRGKLVTTLGVNLSNGSFDSGSESAEYTATLNSAKDALESGVATPIIAALSATNLELGNNSNGNWLKIYITEDTGVMICWDEQSTRATQRDNTRPNGFFGTSINSDEDIVEFAQPFSSIPTVIPSGSNENEQDRQYASPTVHEAFTDKAILTFVAPGSDDTSRTNFFNFIAIGEFDDS